jgi:hypothetical protein
MPMTARGQVRRLTPIPLAGVRHHGCMDLTGTVPGTAEAVSRSARLGAAGEGNVWITKARAGGDGHARKEDDDD